MTFPSGMLGGIILCLDALMRGRFRAATVLRLAALLLMSPPWTTTYAASNDCSAPIRLTVDHWLAMQKASGFLPYGFDFLANQESEQDIMSASNLTRQAYAAAVLADYYESTHDERARPALRKLLIALGEHSLPIGKSRIQALIERTGLLSMPAGRFKIQGLLERLGLLYEKNGTGKLPSPNGDYGSAYSGAVALALMAELRYARASGDAEFTDLRHAWLEGLLTLRIPGDGFRVSPTSIDTTPYFDGEGWLALAEYHRSFPADRRVDAMLAEVDRALMRKYGGEFKFDFYHWGAMAAAMRYANTKEPKFLDFIRAQIRGFMVGGIKRISNENACALVEGSADALGTMGMAGEGGDGLAINLREWIATEMRKVQQLQIQPGQTELVFANAKIIAPRMQAFSGSFRGSTQSTDIQVDFDAHCVSAMLKLRRQDAICSDRLTRDDIPTRPTRRAR